MNDFKDRNNEGIIGVIDILEYILSIKQSIRNMKAHYVKHDMKEDSNIKQYFEMLIEKERELYVLLLSQKELSEIFEIKFKSIANEIAKEENIEQNWLEELQPYLKKIKALFSDKKALQPQT